MNDRKAAGPDLDGRFERLLEMLRSDPENLPLLSETADAALMKGQPKIADDLLGRYARIAPLPPREMNLAGLAAMQGQKFDEAGVLFEQLIEAGERDPALLFNLAWTRAMQKDFAAALELLSEDVTRELPQAAMLHVQILHETGEFAAAGELARLCIERHPDYLPLMAAVSVLALDIDDPKLAARCAAMAPDHADALSTLGTLALGNDQPAEALQMFDRALALNQAVPRAWVGRGLAELMAGRNDRATADLDRGAEMFGTHLGSWIAAGWAYLVAGNMIASRARFEAALRLDPNFAESHGSLAVLDAIDGKLEAARRGSEIALRLDRQSYSGALAKVLLAAAGGDMAGARKIYDLAINTPVDESGRTIAQSLARLGLKRA